MTNFNIYSFQLLLQIRRAMASAGPMSAADIRKRKQMELLRQEMERKRAKTKLPWPSAVSNTNGISNTASGKEGNLHPGAEPAAAQGLRSSGQAASGPDEHANDSNEGVHRRDSTGAVQNVSVSRNADMQAGEASVKTEAHRLVLDVEAGLRHDVSSPAQTQPSTAMASNEQQQSIPCTGNEHLSHAVHMQRQTDLGNAVHGSHSLADEHAMRNRTPGNKDRVQDFAMRSRAHEAQVCHLM
jgi:hypothetical protein